MVRVKICGITNLKDALTAVRSGCDALGFVFYKKSSRYITPGKARLIISRLPQGLYKVGVFVNAAKEEVERIAASCKLDMAQLHGDESPELCSHIKACRVIKAFRLKNKSGLREIKKYRAYAYLFDTYSKVKFGGTGKSFDWKLLRTLRKIKKPVFLAGGLTPKNVGRAIKLVKPEWVDVSSSVESSPGKKSATRIKEFIAAVKK